METRSEGPGRAVYDAEQISLGRNVTLVGLASGVLSTSPPAHNLRREGEALAKLDHPSIVRLYELREQESQLWLVLEATRGTALGALVSKRLSLEAIAAIGLDLARALAHAHGRGLVHGHLHLDCVEITEEGRTKLGGFGRTAQSSETSESLDPASTLALSPESTVGRATSELSDLFALGCLLYELIATEPPFGPASDSHYPERVRHEAPRPLLAFRERIPGPFLALIDECLDKMPSRRPESADAVVSRLEKIVTTNTMPVIKSELARIKTLADAEDRATDHSLSSIGPAERHRMRRQVFGFSALITASLFGALVCAALFWLGRTRVAATTNTTLDRTPTPTEATMLRVVATPWAHVLVDGVHVETTPFAQPLLLKPGRHLVRLEHPYAPPEERPIDGQSGQAVLLNVQMHVKPPLDLGPVGPPPQEDTP